MINTVLFFAVITLALVLGTKLKINIGLVALCFAFLLGTTAGGLTSNGVVSLFPVSLFFNFLMATFLFGFAQGNGTLRQVAEYLIYLCRNAGWLLGLLFFCVTVLVAGLGAGGAAPFFLSAICFSMAAQAGINPLLVSLALWMGPMVGGCTPWTSGYATNVGQLEIYVDQMTASSYVAGFFAFRAAFYTIMYLAAFVALKGYRVNRKELTLAKPEALNEKQRQTLAVILGIIAMIVIPNAIQVVLPNPVTRWLVSKCSFQFLAAIGIVLNVLMKTADYKDVLSRQIPWDTLMMLSLTGMYMALANSMGVVAYLSDLLQSTIPDKWIIPGVVLIMAVLSFFVSGGVVIPMMLPLLQVLAAASGMSAGVIYCATQMGLTASSISPFSQGGASVLTGCADEKVRKKLIRQQTLLAPFFSAVLILVAVFGGFRVVSN